MPKIGDCVPLGEGGGKLHAKFHLDPSNRLATVHEYHRQTDRTGQARQRSDSIGRTVLQTVAKNQYAEKKRSSHKVRIVSTKTGKGLYREKDL